MEQEHPFGETISTYTTEQAVADGALVPLTKIGNKPVLCTSNAFHRLRLNTNPMFVISVLLQALTALKQSNPDDSEYMKLRVLQFRGKEYWAIEDLTCTTILLAEDY